ncbi:hypothetical protein B9Z55_007574 [Caenorhabditis nigoni]|uniref:Uncharacterized protein n=1 Tax=Caenorhabditis nigoni TaxID=1611254 RepID=A0A2G5VA64_9PELO|nr:hypothetical protein B9Z55_007574 [Caenorhabditis nigoni]
MVSNPLVNFDDYFLKNVLPLVVVPYKELCEEPSFPEVVGIELKSRDGRRSATILQLREVLTVHLTEYLPVMVPLIEKEYSKLDVFIVFHEENQKVTLVDPTKLQKGPPSYKWEDITYLPFLSCRPYTVWGGDEQLRKLNMALNFKLLR